MLLKRIILYFLYFLYYNGPIELIFSTRLKSVNKIFVHAYKEVGLKKK